MWNMLRGAAYILNERTREYIQPQLLLLYRLCGSLCEAVPKQKIEVSVQTKPPAGGDLLRFSSLSWECDFFIRCDMNLFFVFVNIFLGLFFFLPFNGWAESNSGRCGKDRAPAHGVHAQPGEPPGRPVTCICWLFTLLLKVMLSMPVRH